MRGSEESEWSERLGRMWGWKGVGGCDQGAEQHSRDSRESRVWEEEEEEAGQQGTGLEEEFYSLLGNLVADLKSGRAQEPQQWDGALHQQEEEGEESRLTAGRESREDTLQACFACDAATQTEKKKGKSRCLIM